MSNKLLCDNLFKSRIIVKQMKESSIVQSSCDVLGITFFHTILISYNRLMNFHRIQILLYSQLKVGINELMLYILYLISRNPIKATSSNQQVFLMQAVQESNDLQYRALFLTISINFYRQWPFPRTQTLLNFMPMIGIDELVLYILFKIRNPLKQ